MSEVILKVGKRGEIYTTKEVRELAGIREGGRVRVRVERGRVIIEPLPTLEELIREVVVEVSPEEAERLSEEAQRKVASRELGGERAVGG